MATVNVSAKIKSVNLPVIEIIAFGVLGALQSRETEA